MIEFPRERKKQTTKFEVGDFIGEFDAAYDKDDPDAILDCLIILKAEHGDESSDDPEDYASYYTFYSYKEEEIWYDEPIYDGVMLYYEKI